MTSRSIQAATARQRAQLRDELFQQRQKAAADAAQVEQEARDAVAAKVQHLRRLREAREAGLPLPADLRHFDDA